jgi:hypothetical protein
MKTCHGASLSFAFCLFAVAPSPVRGDENRRPDPAAVARLVDEKIDSKLRQDGVEPAPTATDEEFLRRVSLDVLGRPPSPDEVTFFVLDPAPDKRGRLVRDSLAASEFARSQARYWREAIGYRAQDRRFQLVAPALEEWLDAAIRADRGWDAIAADLITATGPVQEDGSTGLVVAQMAQAPELAAEVSRLFLGIQIQCAQCHDHPYDEWKREQFHELAAFFARVRVERRQGDGGRPSFEVVSVDPAGRGGAESGDRIRQRLIERFSDFDADQDQKLVAAEVPEPQRRVFDRFIAAGDRNGDKALSLEEVRNLRLPGDRGRGGEYRMPDLERPEAPGTVVHPAFFVNQKAAKKGLGDEDRRRTLVELVTSPENPWFARALVNRVWARLVGQGFVEPVDDMGPGRPVAHPEALDVLAKGFRESGFSLKWLHEAVLQTRAYQRQLRPQPHEPGASRFACVPASRLGADQLFDALAAALDVQPGGAAVPSGRGPGPRDARAQFRALFGFDPSTPQADLQGSIPQALFLMNSPVVHGRVNARGDTPLARLLREHADDQAVISELYLRAFARTPSGRELAVCKDYVAKVGDRAEAFEDIFWSLVNSSEFITRR